MDLPSRPSVLEPIGVAGRASDDQERAYVKQVMFLLRYRMRFMDGMTRSP